MPYVLTNCHNSLCAVGGTINEDDHLFGLSAAQKYGGIYRAAAIMAVIHQYAREMMAGCGKMILGSDSHTRYGALGTMAVGEGGAGAGQAAAGPAPTTWPVPERGGWSGWTGKPRPGVGPQDVALATHRRGLQERLCQEQGAWSSSAPASRACPWNTATASTS